MTQKDIAKEAHVSISTVSRVLSNPNTNAASPEVKESILKLAHNYSYTPNISAQQLRYKGKHIAKIKNSIYCMMATDPEEYSEDPFYSIVTANIRAEALQHGYTVDFSISDRSSLTEGFNNVAGLESCGLIIIGRCNPEIYPKLSSIFKNIIYVGLNPTTMPCDQIVCDAEDIIYSIVNKFYDQGHRRIGIIAPHNEARMKGYKHALKDLGLEYNPDYVVDNVLMSKSYGYNAIKSIFEKNADGKPITAVACANDMIALGVFQACKDLNIRIPDDLNIVGINDLDMLKYLTPSLSSVRIPLHEMGNLAAKILIDRAEGGHTSQLKIALPFELIQRESGPTFKTLEKI